MLDSILLLDREVDQQVIIPATTERPPADSKYRPDIDGLRAIAVAAVVIFHAFPTHLTGGFVGVDVFFVISGYLISSIIYNGLDKGSFTFFHFYGQRVKRIFPTLIVVLAACYIAGWQVLLPAEFKKLSAHIVAGACFVSNFLLYGESGYFDDSSHDKPLLHLWSLGIEEQFYIVWPLILYFAWKLKVNVLLLTVVFALASFTLNVVRVRTNTVQTFYWPTSRAWELLIGASLAFLSTDTNGLPESMRSKLQHSYVSLIYRSTSIVNESLLHNILSIIGLMLIAFPMHYLTQSSIFPGWWAIAPTFGAALLIWVGPRAWFNRTVLSSRLLVGIGLISYPLYLWHWPLLVFTRLDVTDETPMKTRFGLVILSVLLAWLTYVFIDKPLRFGKFSREKIIVLCIAMVGVGCIGYQTHQHDGLFFRFPEIIQNITKFRFDIGAAYRTHTCHLTGQEDETRYGKCVENPDKPASSSVILWGDSHAGHLYPGILAAKLDVRFTQLSADGCPPLPESHRQEIPHCRRVQDYVLKRIVTEKPNTVVLAAFWPMYDWKNLTRTVAALKNASIKNIYLVGPAPSWYGGLRQSLYGAYRRDALRQVPKRMTYNLKPFGATIDADMEQFAKLHDVRYISLYKILCNAAGCLTRTGEGAETMTAWDASHFTIAGSEYVVSHFPRELMHPT